jgi:hypothetical protein
LDGSLWLNWLANQAEPLLTAWFGSMSHIWHGLVQAEPSQTELSCGNTNPDCCFTFPLLTNPQDSLPFVAIYTKASVFITIPSAFLGILRD